MSDSHFQAFLKHHLTRIGINPKPDALEALGSFGAILLDWNQKLHLVSQRDAHPERVARQIIDSLLILHYFQITQNARLLDVGSGAGFPAIPLKLVRPDLEIVLTESSGKKSAYLQDLVAGLRLDSIRIFAGRAKNLSPEYLNHFGYATAKASGTLKVVWPEVYPFLRKEGELLAHKGKRVKEEIKQARRALSKYPGTVKEVKSIDLGDLNLGGCIVAVRRL